MTDEEHARIGNILSSWKTLGAFKTVYNIGEETTMPDKKHQYRLLTDAEHDRMRSNAVELVDKMMVITRGLDRPASAYYREHQLLESYTKTYSCVNELLYLDMLEPSSDTQ